MERDLRRWDHFLDVMVAARLTDEQVAFGVETLLRVMPYLMAGGSTAAPEPTARAVARLTPAAARRVVRPYRGGEPHDRRVDGTNRDSAITLLWRYLDPQVAAQLADGCVAEIGQSPEGGQLRSKSDGAVDGGR